MKSKTLDELPAGFKFKLHPDNELILIKLDRATTPTAEDFYELGDILCADIVSGEVYKVAKETELTYFYRDYVK